MDYVEFFDDGSAKEIYVSGVARIAKISPGNVRITLCSEHEDGNGNVERRAVCHLVLDMQSWADAILISSEAHRVLKQQPANGGRATLDGKRRDN